MKTNPPDPGLPAASTVRAKSAALLDPAAAAALLGEAPALYVADAEGRIMFSTPALDRFHRLEAPDSAISNAPLVRQPLDRLLGGEHSVSVEHAIDGGLRSHHRRVRTGDGKLIFVGRYDPVAMDQRAKQDFLGRMGHDLLTPLNAIIGFAELPLHDRRGELRNRYLGYFESIRSSAQSLLDRLESILEFAEGEAVAGPAIETIDLGALIETAALPVRDQAAARGVIVDIDPTARGAKALGDPGYLARILDNLLRNAVSHSEPGGRVEIATRAGAPEEIEIVVRDEGRGIPEAERERIFETFHRLPADPLIQAQGGLGLGLTLSRRLAREMKGDVRLENEPGKGAVVALRLPAA